MRMYGATIPACCVVHPLEMLTTQLSTFRTYNGRGVSINYYLNIAVNSSAVGDIELNGTPVAASNFYAVPGDAGYSFCRLQLTDDQNYTLGTSGGGYIAQLYSSFTSDYTRGLYHSVGAAIGERGLDGSAWLNNIPSGQLNSTNSHFCPGDRLHFRAMANGVDSEHMHWTLSTGETFTGSDVDLTIDSAGSYLMTVTFTTSNPCNAALERSLTMPFTINEIQQLEFDTVVCSNRFVWYGEAYYDTGLYTRYVVDDSHNCLLVTLHLNGFTRPPQPSIELDYQCGDNFATLTATGAGDHHWWSCDPPDPDLEGHEEEETLTVPTEGQRLYRITCYNGQDSTCVGSASKLKPEIVPFDAVATADSPTVDMNRPVVALRDESEGTAGRDWYMDGAYCGNSQKIMVTYPLEQDSAIVVMDAYDEVGCHDSDTITLSLRKEAIWIPNTFTPSLETNSLFVVKGLNIKDFEIWIYDRRGVIVWHSTDPKEGWDGKHNGTMLPIGVYTYICRYTYNYQPNNTLVRKGTITLIR